MAMSIKLSTVINTSVFCKPRDARQWTSGWIFLSIHHANDSSFGSPIKCVVIHITRSMRPSNCQYTMHNQILATVGTAKNFRVDLWSNLNFNTHTCRIPSNGKFNFGFLKRSIKTKHSGVRQATYQTILKPKVEYIRLSSLKFLRKTGYLYD